MNVEQAGRPVLDGKAGSKRSLLHARSLSRRFLRTLSEMIEEEAAEESNSSSMGEEKQAIDTEKVESPCNSRPRLNAKGLSLVRKSLSKRLLNSISQIIDQEPNESFTDETLGSEEDELEQNNEPERPKMLSRSLSKKLIRTMSQIMDDHSVENSLDIFTEVSAHSRRCTVSVDPGIPKWAVIEDANTPECADGFDNFMLSLLKDESFHNSLNNWMGSLSDVFDENQGASGTRLTDKDREAMNTNVEHMRDLGQYLRKSLSCRNLMPALDESDKGHVLNRRRNFRRCQSFRDSNKSQLSEVQECDLEDVPASPLVIPARPFGASSQCLPRTPFFPFHDDEASSILTETDRGDLNEAPEVDHSNTTYNAALPRRLPSPVKTCVASDILSVDLKHNAAPPVRLPSPVKSPRILNMPTPQGLGCPSL